MEHVHLQQGFSAERSVCWHNDICDRTVPCCGAALGIVECSTTCPALPFRYHYHPWVMIIRNIQDISRYPLETNCPSSGGNGLELHCNTLGLTSLPPTRTLFRIRECLNTVSGAAKEIPRGLSMSQIGGVYRPIFLGYLLRFMHLTSLCSGSKPLLFEA